MILWVQVEQLKYWKRNINSFAVQQFKWQIANGSLHFPLGQSTSNYILMNMLMNNLEKTTMNYHDNEPWKHCNSKIEYHNIPFDIC